MVRFAMLLLLTAARALQLPTVPPRRGVVVAAAPGEPLFLCEEHVAIALDECKREYDAVFYQDESCLLYTSPSPRDQRGSRMPSSA